MKVVNLSRFIYIGGGADCSWISFKVDDSHHCIASGVDLVMTGSRVILVIITNLCTVMICSAGERVIAIILLEIWGSMEVGVAPSRSMSLLNISSF